MSYIELNSTLEYNQGSKYTHKYICTCFYPISKEKKKGKNIEIQLMLCMLKYLRVKWWWYGLPKWHHGKENACQCRRFRGCRFYPRVGKIPWNRKYSCLENPMDRGGWWLIVRRVTKNQTWLSEHNGKTKVI